MKKCYTYFLSTSLFLLFSPLVLAQYTSIPDAEFEQLLITESIDSEGILDGQVLSSDVATVTSLDISYTSISDITGIQDFTSLISFEALQTTNLIDVDLTGLALLEDIDMSYSLNIDTFDVSGCVNLKNLNISHTNFDILDLNSNNLLETIDMSYSGVLNLDLNGKSNLTWLYANLADIQTLDITGCSALSLININETSINVLDLSGNIAITALGFYRTHLTTLILNGCTNLTSLDFNWNYDLASLDLTNCSNLTDISFVNGSFIDIALNTDDLINLETIEFNNGGVRSLDLQNSPNLTTLTFYYSGISNLDLRNGNNTNLDISIEGTSLECISVDDVDYATNNWPDVVDDVVYSTDCSTLTLNEIQTESLKLYPNPSSEFLQISGLQQNVNYSILDFQGKQMQSGTLIPQENIPINSLQSGLYFLRIDSGTNFKFIKK
ncbi:Por secretion system C-terminal sorting domain-containing protein [Bizionia echini]|uniref:Por secretion system C-terminal sorting domain-containing protein n=1 Tax=Bizionia echini TaxID=649333 RepID=A0A1I4ZAC1_9FLAO|nr:T9SS type A sorting domain-containing protein [Bizionia echini]SFN47231.1 Por secretion system C-terminal sorting domain-containing protein [Bizionia echini]